MKIYSMTATFGKLENQTLELKPGLNIIHAPNEWGKSTWCMFLATMLYGLDTREKTTKTSLAVKEHYAPWSGSPMSGRVDLRWNEKDITIERWTKGRTMLGEFRAYETKSGLEIPELTAANCGETLLGVEKSVFLRAGFLRLSDLPVTADDALRRRLNALVTTGDESDAGDELGQKLKELKNKCRSNRSNGLIPQAEEQKKDLENKLLELQTLRLQLQRQQQRQEEIRREADALRNHLQHLHYAAAKENMQRVEDAHVSAEAAAENLAKWEDACAGQICRDEAVAQLHKHSALQQTLSSLLQEQAALPPEPMPPHVPAQYHHASPEQALADAQRDAEDCEQLEASRKKHFLFWLIYGGIAALMLVVALLVQSSGLWIGVGTGVVLGGLGVFAVTHFRNARIQREIQAISSRYPGIGPRQWTEYASFHAETQRQYRETLKITQELRSKVQSRLADTQNQMDNLTGGLDSQAFLLQCNQIIAAHDALTDARRSHQSAAAHADAVRAMLKPVPKPDLPDELTLSEPETQKALTDLELETKQIHQRLGQFQGRMDALGSQEALERELSAVNARLEKLNQTYNALELALQTLQSATAELQRRFAPRIAEAARELFGRLTDGRYDRLNLTQELTVNTAASEEVAIRSAIWRSDGTIDQLYLALRLAVSRELTPEAPLILDDVLVRFDDTRHAAAMEILRQEAERKQIILFTCQSRERNT